MKPQERNLSRIYTRIKRDGKYQTVDIVDMTPEELEEFLNKEGLTIEYFRRLTQNLIEVVQEIADKFDIEVDEEEQKMKQEPTNKELLEIVAILAELSLQIVTENRTYWNHLKNPPETRAEKWEQEDELEEISKRVNSLCEKSQDLVLEHKDLLNLDIQEE